MFLSTEQAVTSNMGLKTSTDERITARKSPTMGLGGHLSKLLRIKTPSSRDRPQPNSSESAGQAVKPGIAAPIRRVLPDNSIASNSMLRLPEDKRGGLSESTTAGTRLQPHHDLSISMTPPPSKDNRPPAVSGNFIKKVAPVSPPSDNPYAAPAKAAFDPRRGASQTTSNTNGPTRKYLLGGADAVITANEHAAAAAAAAAAASKPIVVKGKLKLWRPNAGALEALRVPRDSPPPPTAPVSTGGLAAYSPALSPAYLKPALRKFKRATGGGGAQEPDEIEEISLNADSSARNPVDESDVIAFKNALYDR